MCEAMYKVDKQKEPSYQNTGPKRRSMNHHTLKRLIYKEITQCGISKGKG
jgi:hypothetical protein